MTKVYWVRSPSIIVGNLGQYDEKLKVAVKALADYIASKLQAEARENAQWEDRTGNARTGLFSVAEKAAKDGVTIYLSHGHTVEYGKWLELSRAGKYAIIMKTIEANLPEIRRLLKSLFK